MKYALLCTGRREQRVEILRVAKTRVLITTADGVAVKLPGRKRWLPPGELAWVRADALKWHPEFFPQTRSRRGRGGKRADLGGQFFRSSWEANYARYLNFLIKHGHVESWQFEPHTFEFVGIKRGSRFYTPDFLVVFKGGATEFHELKGYMDSRSLTKLKRMRKYHPGVKVVLIDKARYYGIQKSVAHLIKEWEKRQ